MIQLLFKNGIVSLVIILLLGALSWFMPTVGQHSQYEFFEFPVPKYVALTISFVITVISALIANIELSKRFFINQRNMAFIFFYVMLFSLSTSYFDLLSLSALALSFSVFVVFILRINGSKSRVLNIFNTSFFLGVLCVVSILFLPFIYLIYSGIRNIRTIKIKDVFFVIGGVLTPAILYFAFLFLTDNMDSYSRFYNYSFIVPTLISIPFIVIPLVTIVLSAFSMSLLKSRRMLVGAQAIRVYNVLVILFITNMILSFLNVFIWGIDVFYGCIALTSSIFISVFFVGIPFKGKEFILGAYIILLFAMKFLI